MDSTRWRAALASLRDRRALLPLTALVAAAACGRPMPIQNDWVLHEVTTHYRDFYPDRGDPDLAHDAGLLRPRFGYPAIARTSGTFPIELLERGGPLAPRAALVRPELSATAAQLCLRGEAVAGCLPLTLTMTERAPMHDGAQVVSFLAAPQEAQAPPGGYDLLLTSAQDAPTRVPKAVWLRADDPATLTRLRVAHLSDLHVGKGGRHTGLFLAHVAEVIAAVNKQAPDLVVVTGDLVHKGQEPHVQPVAQRLLRELQAPVLVVMGNHDIEWKALGPPVRRYGLGWTHFAQAFHPFLHFSLSLGGYEFVGFDSGPGERTARILTRGLSAQSIAMLRADLLRADQAGRRGVVLFSHAPSRASLFTSVRPASIGMFGRMRNGAQEFESLLMDAAARGQRVLHLAGHTHWSDVFEVHAGVRGSYFARWPTEQLSPCPRALDSEVAIINTQAASHSGVSTKANARGYGYSMITLGEPRPEIEFFRFGTRRAADCPPPVLRRDDLALPQSVASAPRPQPIVPSQL
ncbi:MAG TPA: metallophosphoesterase [Pseudomonadota bacterium]|nr:metallophosphoesterase [Pseudomonadota bacterium]